MKYDKRNIGSNFDILQLMRYCFGNKTFSINNEGMRYGDIVINHGDVVEFNDNVLTISNRSGTKEFAVQKKTG